MWIRFSWCERFYFENTPEVRNSNVPFVLRFCTRSIRNGTIRRRGRFAGRSFRREPFRRRYLHFTVAAKLRPLIFLWLLTIWYNLGICYLYEKSSIRPRLFLLPVNCWKIFQEKKFKKIADLIRRIIICNTIKVRIILHI